MMQHEHKRYTHECKRDVMKTQKRRKKRGKTKMPRDHCESFSPMWKRGC